MLTPPDGVCEIILLAVPSVRPVRYCYDDMNSFDKTNREYSLAPTDDLIRRWRSKVKVSPWFKHVVAKTSTSMPWGVHVHLLVS